MKIVKPATVALKTFLWTPGISITFNGIFTNTGTASYPASHNNVTLKAIGGNGGAGYDAVGGAGGSLSRIFTPIKTTQYDVVLGNAGYDDPDNGGGGGGYSYIRSLDNAQMTSAGGGGGSAGLDNDGISGGKYGLGTFSGSAGGGQDTGIYSGGIGGWNSYIGGTAVYEGFNEGYAGGVMVTTSA